MNHLYIFTGTITLNSALHLGSGEEEFDIDRLIQRNTEGIPLIPATSIAGVFTSQAERIAALIEGMVACADRGCKTCLICELFGSAEGRASRVTFSDATPTELAANVPEVRDGVGIDRKTLGSREHAKFVTEVLSKSAQFRFQIEVTEATDAELQLLMLTLDEFQSGRHSLGGDTTRGLGNFTLQLSKPYHVDFSDLDQVINYLKADHIEELTPSDPLEKVEVQTKTPDELDGHFPINNCVINLEYSLLSPTVINQGFTSDPDEIDITFVTSRIHIDGELVDVAYLPGSSLKGVLRSRAEKIVRTLSALHAAENGLNYTDILAACDPLEDSIRAELCSCGTFFKRIETNNRGRNLLSWNALKERACLTCLLFGSTHFAGRIKVIDAYPQSVVNKEQSTKFDHVAIDRFTGGAREGSKFDARLLTPEQTPEFYGQLLLRDVEPWQLGMLAFVLKDLYLGDIRVGYGKTKGYGKLKGFIRNVEIGTIPGDPLYTLLETALEKPPSQLYATLQHDATDEALNASQTEKAWLDAIANDFVDKVRTFRKAPDMTPQAVSEGGENR